MAWFVMLYAPDERGPIPMTDDSGDPADQPRVATWPTESEAVEAAEHNDAAQAWGYEVSEM